MTRKEVKNSDETVYQDILFRTPKIEPYYSEVNMAITHLRNGDQTSNPIWKILHGFISARYFEGSLSKDIWVTKKVGGGAIIAHKQFLQIQDDFQELEGTDSVIEWNASASLQSLEKYIEITNRYQLRHRRIYNLALELLSEADQKYLVDIATNDFHFSDEEHSERVIIAIPSHLDDTNLWLSCFGNDFYSSRIPDYAKIHECGVVLASAEHRNDEPKGYDYFSYAARSVKSGQTSNLSEKLWLTAQHEGSHGIIDLLLVTLLRVSDRNPVQEGIIGALGNDGRDQVVTSLTINQLLGVEGVSFDDKRNMEWSYIAGPKFFRALYKIIAVNDQDEEAVWSKIVAAELSVALEMSKDSVMFTHEETEKVAIFLQKVINKLEITSEEIHSVYNSLNIPNGKVL